MVMSPSSNLEVCCSYQIPYYQLDHVLFLFHLKVMSLVKLKGTITPTWDRQMIPTRNKCTKADCTYCPYLEIHGRVISHQTQRIYHAPKGVTCRSNNLIYLITCKKCLAQYVGETYRRLHNRMYEHLRDIRLHRDTPVALHFNRPGHSTLDIKFEVASFVHLPVPPNSEDGNKIRKSVEKLWIHRMRTNRSPGLNILD